MAHPVAAQYKFVVHMELKSIFLLMIGLGMASCHWFDPTDIEDAARRRPHIFVNAVMGEDSTFCSISV